MKYALLVGAAIALAAGVVELLGGFDRWERHWVDLRWIGPRPAQPMSDQIVHVDIDDGAIDLVGKWPWSRSTQADLIDEIARAGAKTIAIDVQWTEADEAHPEHDRRLAETLSRANCVLAVTIRSHELEDLYHPTWLEPAGRIDLQNLMEQLARDIWLEPDAALEAARVKDPGRRARYLRQPLEFKRAAAWGALQRSSDPVTSFEQLEALVAPRKSDRVGRYTERETLEAVWRQYHAWRTLRSGMLFGDSEGSWKDQAPLPIFAEHADMVGYVNVEGQWDDDGVVRQLGVRVGAEGGFVLPFGIAAAALQLGLGAADIIVEEGAIFLGSDHVLPVRHDRLWLNWPKSDSDPRWLGLMRRDPGDPPDAGHISARTLLHLAEDRRSLERNIQRLAELTLIVLSWRGWGDPLSDANRRKIRDWVEFQLGLAPGAMPPENLIDAEKHRAGTPVTRQQIDRWARWLELDALADAERAARRDEWLGLAVGILLEEAPPEVTDVMMEEARTEVTRRLASPETDPYLAEHCGLWNAFDQEVRAGDLAIQAREAELSERLGGKLVFIGYLATGITDLVPTPIDPSTPGVVAHAVVANTVLDKRPVRFLPALVTPIIVLVMGLLGTITALKLSPLPSVAVAVVQVAGYLGAGMLLFASQTLLVPFVAPVLAAAFCWTMAMTTQAASTRRERQRITRQFKARASGQLVEHLVMNPDQLSVSGEEREVAVLFADLANFTSISEALGGELSVATLNRYMTVMVDVLVKDGAYVNKFLGDGLMAFWSAFQIDPQQALKASRSSLACQAAVAKLNAEAKAKGHPEIGLRIGVATGRAVVGDCGAPPAINDYTVIGDVVNLAARLESANKQFKTGTLINERTRELIDADDSLAVRPLGKVVVVGQSTPTMLYELLPPDAPKELIELTQKAVEAYAEAKLDEATTILDELEQRFGPGGVVSVYRDAIANVGDVFDGVLHLRSK